MHLVIINASPRVEAKSNTARIIRTFVRGFEESGNTTEVWHLSDKKQWTGAKEAYEKNSNILFALPLYVESVPGIMLEFLETLQPKKEDGTKMSFILQGGFAEASQLLNMAVLLFPELQLHSWQGRILESAAKNEQKQSFAGQCLHVCRNASGIFVYVLKRRRLHFACTYQADNPADALYYVLFAWKKLNLDANTDSCVLHGYDELAAHLGKYLKNLTLCE